MTAPQTYDVLVVGAGHAGCEAALAAARMGCRTALFTLDRNKVALMPCNPSIGGPGKGHLVREIDALGGEMARNADRTSVQIRMLNTGKGPAVQSLRVQSDKHAYSRSMAAVLQAQADLDLMEASVDDLVLDAHRGSSRVVGIRTADGMIYHAASVVLTTGTFLRGRIIVGDESYPGGRAGEFPADALSRSLAEAGFTLGRLKTGTPPRVRRASIDFTKTSVQEGSPIPLFLSQAGRRAHESGSGHSPSAARPVASLRSQTLTIDSPYVNDSDYPDSYRASSEPNGTEPSRSVASLTRTWREQLNCFLIHTSAATHDIIRRNLHRAPMYNGEITAAGPRYCPSIESKIVRFAGKTSHQLFLEPEGWHTDEIYVQGANTSLPADVQLAMLRTIPALAAAEIVRMGYAIEYDYIPGLQALPTLESKPLPGLYLAGQIIGTTGYEEAGCLGLMAGINAARSVQSKDAIVLRRDQAYIGVLVDDVVTKELDEPYRMHTSQAEYRLLLREDSAEARLSSIGHDMGLVDPNTYGHVRNRLAMIHETLERLDSIAVTPSAAFNAGLERLGAKPLVTAMSGREVLRRVDVNVPLLQNLGLLPDLPADVGREVETIAKYEGYVRRQESEVKRLSRMEHRRIPDSVDYAVVAGLRSESREKFQQVRPRTIGQASRIGGVPPSDVALLLFHLERVARTPAATAGSAL
jgi:tRNA uridine 5-carboxymethylaminomethyl modification enzyme